MASCAYFKELSADEESASSETKRSWLDSRIADAASRD
jgi:hypothetical protein